MENVTIKIGNHLTTQVDTITDKACRTDAQVEAFKKWLVGNEEVLFFSNNPFAVDFAGEMYVSKFKVVYFDRNGFMRSFEMTSKGKMKNHWVSTRPICNRPEINLIINFNKGIVTNF